jgi:hypothetical protein
MAAAPDPTMERLRAVSEAANLRSPLARWFAANRADFAMLLLEYRPRWEVLIEQFAADGLLRLRPEFNSPDTRARAVERRRVVKATMRTWARVQARPPGGPKRGPVASPAIPRPAQDKAGPATLPQRPDDAAAAAGEDEDPRFDFEGARERQRERFNKKG